MEDLLVSRYFVQSDEAMNPFVFPLAPEWWSRPYEYAWASHFAEPDDVVLDAGCGLGHPFKFFLAGRCRETHACDVDPAILSLDIHTIARDFGVEAGPALVGDVHRINYACADITNLPYPDGIFDRVFCISVLEHMDEMAGEQALGEFARVLKPDGLIVITFDFPVIELTHFGVEADKMFLQYAGDVKYSLPSLPGSNAISGYGFNCGRALLRKRVR